MIVSAGGRHSGHLLALACGSFARVGAALAMIVVMLTAFFGARPANLGADAADVFGEVGAGGHER